MLATTVTRNTRLRLYGTAWFLPRSQNRGSHRGYTIWSGTQRKKTPGSPPLQSSTEESCSALSTQNTRIRRQQLLRPSTPLHQWQGRQSVQAASLPRSESTAAQEKEPTNESERAEIAPMVALPFYHVLKRSGLSFQQSRSRNLLTRLPLGSSICTVDDLSVFLLSSPIGLGGFSSIDLLVFLHSFPLD